jgi:peptidoglycan/xylan/chitin deacetylase (PgdA/CDA1 family)
VLKRFKLLALSLASRSGVSALLLNSRWRRGRLLILGYHGFSQDDEHLWEPFLYMRAEVFRERLKCLRAHGCQVLPLGEGLERLYRGTLPERSVVVTIDDGTYDAYRLAIPMLREFGYPATVYLTTYYCDLQRPVFDTMCDYLLWKARGQTLALEELGGPMKLDDAGRVAAGRRIRAHAIERGLSGRDKDALLARVAASLGLDYEAFCRRRLLHIMTREEATELARAGFDIQLHTHRHRVSPRPERVRDEIAENQRRVTAIRQSPARHFCYPGGVCLPELDQTLAACGIESGATCEPGIAERGTPPLHLPRLVDTGSLSLAEFAGWISGAAAWLPRRRFVASEGQVVE